MEEVVFYHTSSCPQCKMVEMLLNKNHINYQSEENVETMLGLGITHTPALKVNNEIIYGKEIINWIKDR